MTYNLEGQDFELSENYAIPLGAYCRFMKYTKIEIVKFTLYIFFNSKGKCLQWVVIKS